MVVIKMIYITNGNYKISETSYINKVSNPRSTPEHTHSFIEICYTLKGKCIHTVDSVEFPTSHGDAIIINYGQTHKLECTKDTVYVDILVKPEMINQSIKGTENAFSLLTLSDFEDFRKSVNKANCLVRFDKNEQAKVEALIDLFTEEQKNNKDGSFLIKKSTLNILLTYIFRKMSLPLCESFSGIDNNVLDYIKQNLGNKLTAQSIAKLCGYNCSYFSKAFKSYYGKTFTKYLTECRIQKACELLESTDKTVEQIIYECGFSDRTRFFDIFEKQTGYTPLKYRKK